MSCITLLSDMGLQDASTAVARGILLQHAPALPVMDITHEIQPFNTRQAAYMLGSSFANFPRGSFHVPLFDIFSERVPVLVLYRFNGHYFLAPDNGLLPQMMLQNELKGWTCFTLDGTHSFHDWIAKAGDIIMQLQTSTPEELGLPEQMLKVKHPRPTQGADSITCEVVHVDQYENVVIDFTRNQYEQLAKDRNFTLHFMRVEEIREISRNYNDVREGYKLCRFNSNDHMEICINRGRAASLFGLKLGGKNNNIKIELQ